VNHSRVTHSILQDRAHGRRSFEGKAEGGRVTQVLLGRVLSFEDAVAIFAFEVVGGRAAQVLLESVDVSTHPITQATVCSHISLFSDMGAHLCGRK
jgi:hypothetical protein